MSPIESLIVDLIRERGPMLGRDIVAAMLGFNVDCVRKLIWDMACDGRLEITADIRFAPPSRPR